MSENTLSGAFPSHLGGAALEAASALAATVHPPSERLIQDSYKRRWGDLTVGGELVVIPYRHVQAPLRQLANPDADLVRQAWLTRSHDGQVREQGLRALLASSRAWHAPFVVQLCGEYVVEIGALIADFATSLADQDREIATAYREFWTDNPHFIELTHARAASYWDAYYRGAFTFANFPPHVALARLEGLVRSGARHGTHPDS